MRNVTPPVLIYIGFNAMSDAKALMAASCADKTITAAQMEQLRFVVWADWLFGPH